MKKLIVSMLCVTILFSNVGWAKTSGEKLQDLQIINGNASRDLLENEQLTRAQLAVILCQLNKVNEEAKAYSQSMGFTDVASDQWYASYVNYCKSQGWLKGVSDTIFDPNGKVNEEMVAIVLERILGYTPAWGEAVELGQELGIHVAVDDSTQILRSEVFDYMYQSLFTKKMNTEIRLYEALNLDIRMAYDELIGEALTDEYDFEYYDIYGNNLKNAIQQSLDAKSQDTYFEQHKNGEIEYYAFRYNDTYIAQEDGMNVVQSVETSQLVGNKNNYVVNKITPDYIIMSEIKDGYIMNDDLYDWNGQLIELPHSSPNHFCTAFEDGYVIVHMRDAYYNDVQTNYLYNTRTKTIEENIYPHTGMSKISDDEWLYYNHYKLVNRLTGEERSFDFNNNRFDASYYINWEYGENYGIVVYYDFGEDSTYQFYGNDLINNELQVVLESENYIIDTAFKDKDAYIINSPKDEYGLMDISGNMLLEVKYPEISQYDDHTLIVYNYDESEFFFNSEYKRVELSEKKAEGKSITMLPNNTQLVNYDFHSANAQLLDAKGNRIKTFDNESSLVYNSNQNVLIGRYSIFTLEGERLNISDDYLTFYDFDGDFINAIDEDNTYIIDLNGHIILGPYDGHIRFSSVSSQTFYNLIQ